MFAHAVPRAFLRWVPGLLVVLPLLLAGCASPESNPPQARANTGYIDFRSEPPGGLWWEVLAFNGRAQTFEKVYSELKEPAWDVLRLAFPPGHHRLQLAFLNEVIVAPVEVEVDVQDGKITPVLVKLSEAGTASVLSKDYNWSGNARGRYGRRTVIGSRQAVRYLVTPTVEPKRDYKVVQQMPYAHESTASGER